MVMHFWRIDGEGYNRDTETDEQAVVYFRCQKGRKEEGGYGIQMLSTF